jgi:hypothetical protein
MYLRHQQRQVGGQQGCQVNQAVKTQGVARWVAHAQQAGYVFQGEGNGEDPLQNREAGVKPGIQGLHATQHHHQHAGQNNGNQPQVKQAPGPSVGLKDDGVEPTTALTDSPR